MNNLLERLDSAGSQGADLSPGDPLAAEAAAEIRRLREALNAILVTTNFISLDAARDYVSEVLEVGIYASATRIERYGHE